MNLAPEKAPLIPPERSGPLNKAGYAALRLFADIRPGEAAKAFLLSLNVFLLLVAYYILKPIREALLLVDKNAPVVKSGLSGVQAVLFVFVIIGFSKLTSRLPRHRFITWTTLFFISNLCLFFVLGLSGMNIKIMGILFFVWIGIFNYFVIAQFWGFANDLYKGDEGRRVFPLVALGSTLGAVAGTRMKWLREAIGALWEYKLMLAAAAILLVCILLALIIHKREVRRGNGAPAEAESGAEAAAAEKPLKPGDGFRLVFKSRYLLLIALMVLISNFVNAGGEYIISDAQTRASLQAAENAGADMQKDIHSAFMDYQFWTNVIALFMQLFLVSRVFKWVGVSGALLVLPLVALCGYGLIAFGAVLPVIRGVKTMENGTDYSLQNTTRAALFLVTPREEKYKAKVAIDTFFVRGGDTLSALAVLAGTIILKLAVEKFALINVACVVVWLALCLLIMHEHKKKAADAAARR